MKISPDMVFLSILEGMRQYPATSKTSALKKAYGIALCFLLLKGQLMAQPYYFRNYQVNNGVSSNTITCILQDKKGFMWYGTRNGLNRFDGSAFRIFRNNPSDPFSLGSNSILSLFEDQNERLWAGTYKGISIYDPVKERFTSFGKLVQSEIRAIKGDRNHHVWIIADQVLYRYDEDNGALTPYHFPNAQTTNIAISRTGLVWVATNNGLIKKYNASDNSFTDYDLSGSFPKNPVNVIQDIYPINDTSIMVGTMHNALLLNTAGNHISGKSVLAGNMQVHQILPQSGNEYWLGTETGLYILDMASKKTRLIQKQRDDPYSLTDNVIYTLYKDREGGTWIGTFFGGINYYARQYNAFQKYFPHEGMNNLSGNLVHEICSDQYGQVWIGTEDAGLNKLDLQTGTVRQFMPGGKGSIAYRNIHGLLPFGKELWIGTYEHGLDVMDLTTEKVIRHYDANTGSGSLKGNFIVTLYKTKKNEILVGTWNGLFQYDKAKDKFIAHPFFTMQIQSIREDDQGILWVASYGKGIYYYDPKTGQGGNLKFEASDPNSLSNNYVNSLYEDSDKNLWICTEGGLNKYEPSRKKFTHYTNNEGLPDNQVFRIMEDNNRNFWISTARGLVSSDRLLQHLSIYTTANGLISNQFNYNSSYKTVQGVLFFGTVKGMISFDPSAFAKNTFIPPVYITGIQVNNREIPVDGKKAALEQSITYAHSISLSFDSSNLSFDVAALSYAIPELNHYAYKMKGLDKDWTVLTSNRKIYYTKLPPGDYTFMVRGSGAGEIWNNKEVRLSIRIMPPFWASTWAYILYGIILIAIFIIILRYYHQAQKEKNRRRFETFEREKEREAYKSKIEFFTNVAHEIRTPLTLIKLPFDKLMSRINDPEINESLRTMKKNINRLIDLTNQLLDFRKAEANHLSLSFTKTDVQEAVTEVYQAFKPLAEQKNLGYTLELPRITLQAYVDREAFQKILSNLFSNAIKYAESQVAIRLLPFSSEDNFFNLEVRNDGHLIPQQLKEKIFEPFYRIRETEKQEGTGIGLPLSRALAELHKGALELRQSGNNMNTFLLSLPIHQDKEINFVKEPIPQTNAGDEETILEEGIEEKPSILLVEDNKEILEFIRKELSAHYRMLKAFNGQEAMDILQKENVLLVISDIMMPVMNGIELCKKLKTDLQFSHIPFILLTAKNTLNSRIEGLEVGADAYIEKPFSLEHLQAQISNLMTNRQIIKEYFARSPLTHLKGIACSNADKNFLEKLQDIIDENITNMELDVDQLSRLVNMSRPTLYRKIKALSNLTPNELINLSRLKKAAELLAGGNYKINEVANMVGYTLQSNFSRDFHRQFGQTPSAYLNHLQEEKK
jgi:ligand-binding sensor domain-containing protein/signal transduction histidine kinase/DNA-binding response OmpR family regulator